MASSGGWAMKPRTARQNDCAMARAWTAISSLRLSERSATRPAKAPIRRTGPNWAAARAPRAQPLSVSFSTSSVWATSVSQLPTWEMSWPPKKRRKFRTCIERKMSLVACRIRVTESSGDEFVEDVEGVGEAALTIGVELADARRQPRRLTAAGLLQQGFAGHGDG